MEIKSTKEYSLYKALLEASPDAMVIVDAHGNILHTNSQTEILFGYKKNELDGKAIEILITAALQETYLKYKENYLQNPNVQSMGTVPDLEVIKKDSTKFSVEVSLSPLQTVEGIIILISIRNITDRKKTNENLITSELRYRRLFQTAQDGILILDADTGKIEDVNPFLMMLLDFKYPEFIGKQLWEIGFFKDIIANKACFLKLQQEGFVRYENLPLKSKGGQHIWVEFVSNVYDVNGKKVVQCNIRDITDRKIAEEKLKQLLQAVEQSPASIIVTGIDGNIQYVNKKFVAVSGYELAEVLGKNPRILKSGHTSETEYAYLWKNIASGQEWKGEFHNKKKNGEFYWESASISPIINEGGKIINYLAIKEDITEQKKVAIELTEKEFFLRESQRAGKIGSYKTNFVTGYWQSSETLDSIFGIDENFDRSLAGWLEIIHPDDRQKMEEYLRLEVIGKRKAFNKEYRIKAINDKQTKWLLGLGEVIIDDSGNVTGLIGTIQDVTERKNVEELLRQSESNLRTIFDNTNTGFYLLDIEGNIISFNKMVNQFAKLSFGFELQEKKNLIMMMSPDRRQQFFDIRNEILSGSNFNYEVNYPHLDGSIIWYSINASHVCDSYGKVIGISVAVNDITKRKLAEEILMETTSRLKHIYTTLDDSFWATDIENNKMLYVSPGNEKIYGYPEKDFLDNPNLWHDLVVEEDKHKFDELYPLLINRKSVTIEFRINYAGSSIKWLESRMVPTLDATGKLIRIDGITLDITEQKNAEEKLWESHERYEFVNKATQDTIWEWDHRTNKGKWGEGIITTFGYTIDQLNYAEHWHNEFVHPLDKERVREALEICHRERKDKWQNEYRFRCADGNYKNVFDRGFILYDKQGNPYRMIGAMTDLTEKKSLERKLVLQQIKHQKLITEVAIESQEKEKNELGKELHDNINQILATVKMYLGIVKLKEENSAELVEKSFEHVTLAMDEIRKLSHSLVPPYLGDIGLKDALKELINEMNISNKIQIKLSNEINSDKTFDKKIELMIYRIVQEQMNNIFKYSEATNVLISLKKDDNTIFLSVSDNGIGFDTTRTRKGIGLKNIQSRVDFYTGNMKIISAPGQGCTLEINFPVNNKTVPA